jgi:hypothetical protein
MISVDPRYVHIPMGMAKDVDVFSEKCSKAVEKPS